MLVFKSRCMVNCFWRVGMLGFSIISLLQNLLERYSSYIKLSFFSFHWNNNQWKNIQLVLIENTFYLILSVKIIWKKFQFVFTLKKRSNIHRGPKFTIQLCPDRTIYIDEKFITFIAEFSRCAISLFKTSTLKYSQIEILYSKHTFREI